MADIQSGPDGFPGIAVVGMAGRFPQAANLDAFWELLCDGREGLSHFSAAEVRAAGVPQGLLNDRRYVLVNGVLADIDLFDASFFGMNPREASLTDPQHRIFLELAWQALEHCGHDPATYQGTIGVYAGCGLSSYLLHNLWLNRVALADVSELRARMANSQEYLATRVSYKLNLTGPSININTACSTSLVAVHMACDALLNFQCDMALGGGISIQVPQVKGYLYEEGGILSPDGHCRAFDSAAQGTVSGNGGAVVVLRRLADALADGDTVYAVIRGGAINNDGAHKAGYTAPSVNGQARVIAEAQAVAGIEAETIGYVETHGTATPLGDPIELAALTQAFRTQTARTQFCAIGSVKTNVGHLDEAAGVTGLIKTVLSLYHHQIPPSLHFKRPNPEIDFAASPFYVNTELRHWPTPTDGTPRRAAVSSFGIGGTNAHVVLEEAPARPALPSPREACLLVLSARTRSVLETACQDLADHLEHHPEISLADVAFTLAVGRHVFPERRALVCCTHADAIAQLRSGVAEACTVPTTARQAVFLFPGQGSQLAGMGTELYRIESIFREAIDKCADILNRRCGFDLRKALFRTGGSSDETITAQPTLFAVEYAVAVLLQTRGIEPHAMIGHSLGEYVAATLAGVFSLEDTLALVAERGRLMQTTAPGAMIAVPMSEAECASFLKRGLSIAAVNAPSSIVLSGSVEAVALAEAELTAGGVTSIRLRTSHAFHSPAMEPILGAFRELVKKTALHAPAMPFISNITGDWITSAQATDPEYWVRHLREPVLFSAGVTRLLDLPDAVWIEVGPGRALTALVERHPGGPHVLHTMPSTRSKNGQSATILSTLGQLWSTGVPVDWKGFFKGEQRRRIPLPTYPFERQRYWIDAPAHTSQPQPPIAPVETAIDYSPVESWFYAPRWRQSTATSDNQLAGGAWVVFGGEPGLTEAVTSHLREVGALVTVVRHGDAYARLQSDEFVLPLDEPAAHARLWRDLDKPIWSEANLLLFAPGQGTTLHAGVLRLLALVQAIGSSTAARKLAVITYNAQAVLGSEVSCPTDGMVCGALGVVAQEYPNLECCVIDLDGCDWEPEAAANVLAGLSRGGASLALREGSVWEQGIEPAQLARTETPRIRQHGTYLITGGLGSMGLAFAEHLAQTARARLVLVSRTGLTGESQEPRSRFPLLSDFEAAGLIVAETTDPDAIGERNARIRERLSRIEAAGAEVCVIAADISNADDVARAVETAERRFGPINGVIHAAGVLGQTLIYQQTQAEVRRVLAPKVEGTLHLASALGNRPLDFFILCSSMSSIEPIPGQFAYSAANAFLDSFARFRAARYPGLTVSIDWGFWQELGMIEAANVSEAVKRSIRDEIKSKGWSNRGVEIFTRILRSQAPAQLLVSPRQPSARARNEAGAGEMLDHPVLRSWTMENTGCAVFSGTISESSTWLVSEHRVGGQTVLPATAYLDLAVTAFWHRHGRCPVELTDVCFLTPMAFTERETKQVRLILEENSGSYGFRVVSQLSLQMWQEHARGEIQACPPDTVRERIDLEKIEQRLAAESDGCSHIPAGFWERVKSFGPHWRNVADAVFGSSEGVARFELAPELTGDLSQFALHPALLDTATGFMVFRIEFDPFVPFSFRRVRVFDRLPASCASTFRFVPDSPVFAGSVVDALGNEIVRVEEYTLRRAVGGGTAARSVQVPPENVTLEIGSPGELQTLIYRPSPRLQPRAGEVEIEVRAAGLNFIEVLYALGMLPQFNGRRVTFGQECAGVVTRAGDGIEGFKPGDEVIAYGPACFSLYTTLRADAVAQKPAGLSFEEAAGLPAAFATSWYSLMQLARLQPGERVLIHAAAGGVGLAAVRIAQWRGAEIFATAGSPEKRRFLSELGIAHVMDSRSLVFADEVRRITNGEGIDVVLNSLSGDFIAKSLELLRRHGRFLELGKRDIFRNTALGMGAFANYIAFFAVDMGPDVPGFAVMWRELMEHFRSQSFGPVPYQTFPATRVQEAFEHMAQARHIGKVVLSFEDAESVRAAASAPPARLRWADIIRRDGDAALLNSWGPAPTTASVQRAAELAGYERPPLPTEFRVPESATEKAIAGLWEKLLGVAPIGTGDDFFALKGDSLLAAQAMSQLQRLFEVKLPLSLIFDFSTIQGLAAQIDSSLTPHGLFEKPIDTTPAARLGEPASVVAERILPAPPQTDYPLTHAQKRLWILAQNPVASVAYNMSYSLSLGGALDITALRQAFGLVIGRHEALRTAFITVSGEPRQQVRSAQPFYLPVLDLRGESDAAAAVDREIGAEALMPFHLDQAPLLRARLLHVTEHEYVLLVSLHHIIADGLSLNVLMRELHVSYAARCANIAPDLPPLTIQYKDFAVWQQQQLTGKAMEAHRAYWLEKLGGELPALALPTDRPRPPLQQFSGGQVLLRLPVPAREAVYQRCHEQGVSLFMLLVAALKVLLHQTTGQADILIGSPVAGREQVELEGQIGYYLNNVVLRDTIRRSEPFTALLQRVRNTVTEAIAHQAYPFDLLIEELAITPAPGHSPLFDVQLNLMPNEVPSLQLSNLAVAGSVTNSRTTIFDLNFMFSDGSLGLAMEIGYSTALFDAASIEQLGDRMLRLLTAIGEQREATVRFLCTLLEERTSAAEKAEFLAAALNLDEEF